LAGGSWVMLCPTAAGGVACYQALCAGRVKSGALVRGG
jgi:hypothetical protein